MYKVAKNMNDVWNFVSVHDLPSEEDYFNHHKEKYLEIKNIMEHLNPKKVLDIGAGTGIFYSLLTDMSLYEIHALEYVGDFIPLLKSRGIIAKQCNIEKESFPYQDDSFNLVICDSILEHTLNPKHLVAEIYRNLKPDGRFVVVVPNAISLVRRWNHLRGRNIFEPLIDNLFNKEYLARCSVFYSERDIYKMFAKNNLKIINVRYVNETSHDNQSYIIKILRILSRCIHASKDVIIVTGVKE